MYYYIYDSFLDSPKYNKILDRIELTLADLGIAGESARIRPLRSIEEAVLEGLDKEKRNIIAVGDDSTFKKIANAILDQDKVALSEIALGMIPVRPPYSVSQALGVPFGEAACNSISRRVIKLIDLGKINREYFVTQACIGFGGSQKDRDKKGNLSFFRALHYHPPEIILNLDQKFQVRLDLFRASCVNLSLSKKASPRADSDDGILNIFVTSKLSKLALLKNLKLLDQEQYYSLSKTSIFKAKKIEVNTVSNKPLPIFADNQKVGRTPTVIEAAPQKIKVIVGKNRSF